MFQKEDGFPIIIYYKGTQTHYCYLNCQLLLQLTMLSQLYLQIMFIVILVMITEISSVHFYSYVKGRITCTGKVINATVDMYDADGGNIFDPDDHLGSARFDDDGYFWVNGSEDEINEEFFLDIKHDCRELLITIKNTVELEQTPTKKPNKFSWFSLV